MSLNERSLCFRIFHVVVVEKRQRLLAAVDEGLLGIRWDQIAGLRAVIRRAKAVDPVLPDSLTGGFIIRITLEIVHDEKVNRRKAPDVAFVDGRVGRSINFIYPPVVGLAEFKKIGRIVRRAVLLVTDQSFLPICHAGFVDIVEIGAEVDIMFVGVDTRLPA